MARSYRTEKPSVLARYRIPRDRDNRLVFPRVIDRRPSPGDVHPLSKQALSGILRQTPIEYLYGLKRIELRPRRNNKIGEPFGCYLPDEKAIWLYSLPPVWRMKEIPPGLRQNVESFGATVVKVNDAVEVRWLESQSAYVDIWFLTVLMHELGHHFVEQYKNQRGKIGGRHLEEKVADLRSMRLTKHYIDRVMNRRQAELSLSRPISQCRARQRRNDSFSE